MCATPGIFSASVASIFAIFARGCGQTSSFTQSILGQESLVVYSAVSRIVSAMDGYAAHLQMCPDIAYFTSSRVGLLFLSRRAFAVTDQPGVQNPQSAAMYM